MSNKKREFQLRKQGHTQELILKEEGQEYGQVLKLLGGSRINAMCFDGKERLCIIRGAIKKRTSIHVGDIILVSLRDFQDNKADIIHKYSSEDATQLKKKGLLPPHVVVGNIQDNDIDDEISDYEVAFEDI